MLQDLRIFIYVFLVGAAVVYGVFLFPPITNGVSSGMPGVSQAEFDALVDEERAFCQAQPDAINCRCFATLSGTIQAHSTPKVRGAVYADKQQLARGQAADAC